MPGGAFTWLGGGYLAVRDEDYSSSLDGLDAAHRSVTARTFARKDNTYEAAVFGDVTARLTPELFLTVGLRLSLNALSASSLTGRSGVPGLISESGTNDSLDTSPRVALNYHPDSATTVYLSVSRGYRPGGVNINGPASAINANLPPPEAEEGARATREFASDELWTAELGAKMVRLGGKLESDAAVWISRWNNVQSDQILPDGTLYVASVGNVVDPGLELDVTARPWGRIVLHASGYLSDPEISRRNVAFVPSTAQLPAVPRQSFNVSARNDWRLDDTLDSYAAAGYDFTGRSYLNYDPAAALPMGNFGTINMQLGLVENPWQVSFSIDNVLDARANTLAFGNPFLLGRVGQITPLRPRTFRLEIRRSF